MCAYYIHQVLMFVERKCTLHFNPCELVNTTEKLRLIGILNDAVT